MTVCRLLVYVVAAWSVPTLMFNCMPNLLLKSVQYSGGSVLRYNYNIGHWVIQAGVLHTYEPSGLSLHNTV